MIFTMSFTLVDIQGAKRELKNLSLRLYLLRLSILLIFKLLYGATSALGVIEI